jgi:hypothetical protein
VLHFVHLRPFGGVTAFALIVFIVVWSLFWFTTKGGYFYFDPQDCFDTKPTDRALPRSAESATFEPMLKHYIGVTQLLVTVAAASIAFGGNGQTFGSVVAAKMLLAWSIFYGVPFCAVLLWRYDEYTQNVKSYTRVWYSTVFALGISSLLCFMVGYLVWGWGLSKLVP